MGPHYGWPFLSVPNHPWLSAAWALFIHGALALVAIGPVLWRARRRALYGSLVFAGASLVDLDHLAVAGAVNVHAIETMSGRPDTHGMWTAVIVALLAWLLSRRKTAAWCVFAVVTSHLVFDAAGGGTPLLFPVSPIDAVPWLACPAAIVALAVISAAIQTSGESPLPARQLPRNPRADSVAVAADTA
jgi:hypothetical protein